MWTLTESNGLVVLNIGLNRSVCKGVVWTYASLSCGVFNQVELAWGRGTSCIADARTGTCIPVRKSIAVACHGHIVPIVTNRAWTLIPAGWVLEDRAGYMSNGSAVRDTGLVSIAINLVLRDRTVGSTEPQNRTPIVVGDTNTLYLVNRIASRVCNPLAVYIALQTCKIPQE